MSSLLYLGLMKTIKAGQVTWILLEQPGQSEVNHLEEKQQLPSSIYHGLLQSSARPRLLQHGPYRLLILHFPIYQQYKKKVSRQEIHFLAGPGLLVSTHWRSLPPLQELRQDMLSQMKKQKASRFKSSDELLCYILQYFYDFLFRELDHIQADLEWLEDNLFTKIDREMIKTISTVRNNITSFQQHIHSQDEVLTELKNNLPANSSDASKISFDKILGKFKDIQSILSRYAHTVTSLHQTQDSLLNVKINEMILFLTIVATLSLPFGVVTLLSGSITKTVGLIIATVIDLLFVMWIYRRKWL